MFVVKVKSIFKGRKVRKVYYIYDGLRGVEICDTVKTIEDSIAFHTCEIETPIFKEDEKVYISEFDKIFTIVDRVRNLDGGIVYTVLEPFEIIEDEITKQSLIEAEYRKEELEKINSDKVNKTDILKKKWYQFWIKEDR